MKKLEHITDVIRELVPLKDAFPNVIKLLVIASTIAVCTATCERSFVALKRIKNVSEVHSERATTQ